MPRDEPDLENVLDDLVRVLSLCPGLQIGVDGHLGPALAVVAVAPGAASLALVRAREVARQTENLIE